MDKKPALDKIDLKILDVLQRDGRITYQRLSEQVNLTPRPCLDRVKRLERAGIIAGYRAIVNLPQTPRPLVVLAQITLADHGRSQPAFEAELRRTDAVLDCWLVSGTFDFLVRLACPDMAHYRDLADTWLKSEQFTIEKIVTSTEIQVIKRV